MSHSTRDRSHAEQIERWARFVRENPIDAWKPQHSAFIDSQLEMANAFYTRLAKQPGGKETIEKLRKLRVERGSP